MIKPCNHDRLLMPSVDYNGKYYCRGCEKRFEIVEWLPKESQNRANVQECVETEEEKWKRWMDPNAIRDQYLEARLRLIRHEEIEFRSDLLCAIEKELTQSNIGLRSFNEIRKKYSL